MLAGGVVLIIIGALIAIIGFAAGLFGFGLALPIGGSILSLGVMFAIAGAIVNAIREHKDAVLAEIRGEREDLRIGFKSLWDELDQVRANTTASAPVPVYGTVPVNPGDGQLLKSQTSAPGFWAPPESKQ